MSHRQRFGVSLVLACSIALGAASMARAGGIVTACGDDAALSSALVDGGRVTFDCGGKAQPATIHFRSTKTIDGDVEIDGGGKVTLDGASAMRLFVVDPSGKLRLENLVLQNGSDGGNGGDGGCVFNGGSLTLIDTFIRGCNASGDGGGVATSGTLNMIGGALAMNQGVNGGGLAAKGSTGRATITGSRIDANRAQSFQQPALGAGIYVFGGASITVSLSEVVSNITTSGGGGGIANVGSGSSTIVRTSNVHNNGSTDGGGIFNLGGSLTVEASSVSGNFVPFTGGGIKNDSGTATLSNVTLSDDSSEDGAGFYNFNGTANLTNVTIAHNFAGRFAGGIFNAFFGSPHLNLTNVLLSGGGRGDNCLFVKDPDSSTANLSSDGSCGLGTARDNAPLQLGTLGSNGGPTPTHRLAPGSPAIDAGTLSGCPSGDQRGVGRFFLHSCDVGAVEFVPCVGAPPAPVLLSPQPNEVIKEFVTRLDWAGPDCATQFSVELRLGTKKGRLLLHQDGVEDTQLDTPLLRRGHTYFWQVTACNAAGCTPGEWRRFKLAPKV